MIFENNETERSKLLERIRELEFKGRVESSLDEVRDRLMKMDNSSELKEVVKVLYHELNSLHLGNWGCNIMIFNQNQDELEIFLSGDGALQFDRSFIFPNKEHPVIEDQWTNWKNKNDQVIIHLEGKAKESYDQFVFTETDFKYFPDPLKQEIRTLREVYFSYAYFCYGYLVGISSERALSPDEFVILGKFAKVFEQAYTRFLDLKKAEAQAREAEIQLGLERVRVRAMAMHGTEELGELIGTVFKELTGLDLVLTRCIIMIFEPHTDDSMWWMANSEDPEKPSGYLVPNHDNKPYLAYVNAWKNLDVKFKYLLEGEEKMEWDDRIFSESELSTMPKQVIEGMKAPDRVYLTASFNKFGCLSVASLEPISEEQEEILIRFAKVFDGTYTRFNDLKRAESQAREAEIQLALERVRARSMAMHDSSEMLDVADVLFRQLRSLGGNLWGCGVIICKEDREDDEVWFANENGVLPPIMLPHTEDPTHKRMYKGWLDQIEFYSEFKSGPELKKHYDYMLSVPSVRPLFEDILASGISFPTWQKWHAAYFSQGYLLIITLDHYEEEEIFSRFAKVFDQAYTRFLDLKKAEAQAREAQIEAALERVRAASMAMHHSNELPSVALVVLTQIEALKIPQVSCSINIVDNQTQDFIAYSANSVGENNEKIMDQLPLLNLNEIGFMREAVRTKKYWGPHNTLELRGELLEEMIDLWKASNFSGTKNKYILQKPDVIYLHWASFNDWSSISLSSVQRLSEEQLNVLVRMAKTFSLSYTRFLDLQKAEEQAREAQIQLALERVRARTMAMHSSKELSDAATILFKQILALDLKPIACGMVILNRKTKHGEIFITADGTVIPKSFIVPYHGEPVQNKIFQAWSSGESSIILDLKGKKLENHLKFIGANMPVGEMLESSGDAHPDRLALHVIYFNHGFLGINYTEPNPGAVPLLLRFAKVFEQTYTRFLDLQKAEAQSRESQIEAAIERIRSRSLAMQDSVELTDVATVLYNELKKLEIPEFYEANIVVIDEENNQQSVWSAHTESSILEMVTMPLLGDQVLDDIYENWNRKEVFFSRMVAGVELQNHQKFVIPEAERTKELDVALKNMPDPTFFNCAFFSKGFLEIVTDQKISISSVSILIRFAKVFEQSYIRFLDLQKAEAQAREAQIEAALERVRAQAMAMRNSDDLTHSTRILFEELAKLKLDIERSGIGIFDEETRDCELWTTVVNNEGNIELARGITSLTIHPMLIKTYASWENQQSLSYTLEGKELKEYYAIIAQGRFHLSKELISKSCSLPKEYYYYAPFNAGGIYFFSESEPKITDKQIINRFAEVFNLTYTRFLDLQRAEAQAKETIKQASLDRVRGEIASMRSTDDLDQITPLIWNELTVLGVRFIRCGVFIIHEESKSVNVYLSTPDGKSLGVLHLNFEANDLTINTVKAWKNKNVYHQFWDKEAFIAWTDSLLSQNIITDKEKYQGHHDAPEALHLNFIPFSQGMLYVGTSEKLSDDGLESAKALAKSFSIAYSRYEDFVQLEKAKSAIESTLTELKSAQNQLIHSEKMASLGELTAGIAHEIQNPLNFVNNFSEVSEELIDEITEELEAGDTSEVKVILEDLKKNLEKINHHGKRAESIVKGMLLHSRSTKGEKVPTDINALCDEFLRLSYHGLRAKDRSFNAEFEMDFDESIPKIEVVPQDIGRVLLNLFNNAFQACGENRESSGERISASQRLSVSAFLSPKVTVRTRNLGDKIQISVIDNGPGIPEEIKDKIFQPFFTTKPTGQGTGLGLSLAYDIVKAHGGEIEVKTKARKGTILIISLSLILKK